MNSKFFILIQQAPLSGRAKAERNKNLFGHITQSLAELSMEEACRPFSSKSLQVVLGLVVRVRCFEVVQGEVALGLDSLVSLARELDLGPGRLAFPRLAWEIWTRLPLGSSLCKMV